jgi:hypothetical protein
MNSQEDRSTAGRIGASMLVVVLGRWGRRDRNVVRGAQRGLGRLRTRHKQPLEVVSPAGDLVDTPEATRQQGIHDHRSRTHAVSWPVAMHVTDLPISPATLQTSRRRTADWQPQLAFGLQPVLPIPPVISAPALVQLVCAASDVARRRISGRAP